jgi:hypothetical protein
VTANARSVGSTAGRTLGTAPVRVAEFTVGNTPGTVSVQSAVTTVVVTRGIVSVQPATTTARETLLPDCPLCCTKINYLDTVEVRVPPAVSPAVTTALHVLGSKKLPVCALCWGGTLACQGSALAMPEYRLLAILSR